MPKGLTERPKPPHSARKRGKTTKSAKGVWGKTRVFPHKQLLNFIVPFFRNSPVDCFGSIGRRLFRQTEGFMKMEPFLFLLQRLTGFFTAVKVIMPECIEKTARICYNKQVRIGSVPAGTCTRLKVLVSLLEY